MDGRSCVMGGCGRFNGLFKQISLHIEEITELCIYVLL
jgi:hypothetical protein